MIVLTKSQVEGGRNGERAPGADAHDLECGVADEAAAGGGRGARTRERDPGDGLVASRERVTRVVHVTAHKCATCGGLVAGYGLVISGLRKTQLQFRESARKQTFEKALNSGGARAFDTTAHRRATWRMRSWSKSGSRVGSKYGSQNGARDDDGTAAGV